MKKSFIFLTSFILIFVSLGIISCKEGKNPEIDRLQQKVDSLLYDHNKETVVEKKPGLMKMLKWVALGILVAVIGFFAVSSAFIKKR